MEVIKSLLFTLLLTIVVEYPIVQVMWLAIKQNEESKFLLCKNRVVIIPSLIVNVLTNPAINIFALYMFRETEVPFDTIWVIITILELIIWAIEGALYKLMLKTSWVNGLMMAITANYVSYLFSFLM